MIKLVKVDKDNWRECIHLPTSEAHQWVASNVYSIAEAQFYPKANACCIYADEQMVGFVMYGLDEDDETVMCVDRLMVAEPHRGQGYGTTVLMKIIEEATTRGLRYVQLSTAPENVNAKHVYENVGFVATGTKDGDEDVYRYPISPSPPNA